MCLRGRLFVVSNFQIARRYRSFENPLKTASTLFNFQPTKSSTLKNTCYQFSQTRTMGVLSPLDPSSFSRPDLAVVKHVSLSLNINFEDKVLSGSALLEFDVREDVNELILDVGSQSIESIEEEDGTPLQFKIDEEVPNFGSKLTISLPKQYSTGDKIGEQHQVKETDNGAQNTNVGVKKIPLSFDGYVYRPIINDGAFNDRNKDPCKYCFCFKAECLDKNIKPMNVENDSKDVFCSLCHCTVGQCFLATRVKISIKYSTAPSATALQWLEPSQTSGKKHPYLYSQCQPIHARSILPCQDTPAVKFTYDAQVTAPDEFTVLMSAIRGERRGNFTVFNQPTPIPSYLLAIAVGVLESRRLGPRSLVWSEKEEIEQSAWEFAETEKYLQAAEQLCGPYVWSQYDLLVLPSSFPYGGMENPCLTFVTPTLLAGDRSQANVIVHEIMHSWTGNLVTNRNFEHFWLNEGFTVFLERKVQASLIVDPNKARITRDFESLLGLQELDETVRTVGVTSPLTHLVMDLNEVHPDDSFSRVPYEKGSLFLRYLEDLVGGPEVFDDFLRCYLQTFAKKSLDTEQFKTFLLNYFKDSKKLDSVDWNAWLHTPGMPPIIPDYDTSMTKSVIALLTKIEQGAAPSTFSEDEIKTFTPSQLIHLLQSLIDRPPLPLDTIRSLGEAFNLNNIKNTELIYRWIRLCIRSKDSSKLEDTYNFVNHIGRMKYVRPIYRDLYAWEEVRKQSIDNFLKNEKYMMHVSAYTLRKDLHLAE